ncbi:4Fe-4S dicluster domain-containing protein [Thermodesulfobacteriota bacterium]
MTDKYLIEPDVNFVREVVGLGGDTLKKCFQCATCSVICPISPDTSPFPRKEMLAASWGLKDKLVANHDIWLCHHCGDCTTKCPRGAKPGETLSAIRSYAIADYAVPPADGIMTDESPLSRIINAQFLPLHLATKTIGKAVNDPKMLPLLIGIPTAIFLGLGLILKIFGINWLNWPGGDEIVHSHFFNSWLVDLIFVPLVFFWIMPIFTFGLTRFIKDIHANAILAGKTDKTELDAGGFIKALIYVIPTILKQDKFTECDENKDRDVAHLMVFLSFIALFIVTNIFFIHLYVLQWHGPYPQWHPAKWLANIGGVALIAGGILMIKNRLGKTDQPTYYKDWYLIGLVLGLGLTGMLTEMTRLMNLAGISYGMYFIHLIFVFNLFAFLPFSKLAHLVYRTVAMAYDKYIERQ